MLIRAGQRRYSGAAVGDRLLHPILQRQKLIRGQGLALGEPQRLRGLVGLGSSARAARTVDPPPQADFTEEDFEPVAVPGPLGLPVAVVESFVPDSPFHQVSHPAEAARR